MVVQLFASMWALRNQGSLGERLAKANGIAWTGLMLAMIPAGLAWAFFPPPYVSVPPPFWLVMIPAVEVAVACAAIDVALTLMVEVIVFAARAWHRDVGASRLRREVVLAGELGGIDARHHERIDEVEPVARAGTRGAGRRRRRRCRGRGSRTSGRRSTRGRCPCRTCAACGWSSPTIVK